MSDEQQRRIRELEHTQAELAREVEAAWRAFYQEQGVTRAQHHAGRAIAERRLVWPVRLLWRGFGFEIGWRGIRRKPFHSRAWCSRHGAQYPYGVVQYLRFGPVIVELGRDEALRDAMTPPGAGDVYGPHRRASETAKATAAQILARCQRSGVFLADTEREAELFVEAQEARRRVN